MNNHHYAIIMAGGIGKRFWPLSKKDYPKQFLDILGHNQTLFQETYNRFKAILPEENIYVVTNEDYIDLIKEQIPTFQDHQILAEPVGRNTAPAIAYGAHKIDAIDPEGVMVVAPSDHLIRDEDEFQKTILEGLQAALKDDILITLGIKPSRPDTGYGYIQMADDNANGRLKQVKTFTEKPNYDLAKYFLESDEFFWNSGIFIWSIQSILKGFQNHLPELFDNFDQGKSQFQTNEEADFIKEIFPTLPMISIDYGIMEKAENVYVLPADFQWSDIGTWNAVFDLLEKDEGNNALQGKKIFARDTNNCLVNVKSDKLVALNNVDNLIVVDTGAALLVADKNKEQEIRQIVNEIKAQYGERYT